MYFTVNNKPVTSTLQTSAAATSMFCPLTQAVQLAGKKVKAARALHYFAFPVDSVIQAVAMPVFTLIDHFRDIVVDFRNGRKKWGAAKVIASVVSLPIKELGAVALSTGYLFNGAASLIFPWHLLGVLLIEDDFFKAMDEYMLNYQSKAYSIRPLRPLGEDKPKTQCMLITEQKDAVYSRSVCGAYFFKTEKGNRNPYTIYMDRQLNRILVTNRGLPFPLLVFPLVSALLSEPSEEEERV